MSIRNMALIISRSPRYDARRVRALLEDACPYLPRGSRESIRPLLCLFHAADGFYREMRSNGPRYDGGSDMERLSGLFGVLGKNMPEYAPAADRMTELFSRLRAAERAADAMRRGDMLGAIGTMLPGGERIAQIGAMARMMMNGMGVAADDAADDDDEEDDDE